MLKDPSKDDPTKHYTLDPGAQSSMLQQEGPDGGPLSSSSESSGSTDDGQESEAEDDPIAAAREWDPETIMYQNEKSNIVHVIAVGGADEFSCGIRRF
jgi:hypothetical protein